MRSQLGWGAAIVLCVLVQGLIFGIGLLIGGIIGQGQLYHRRYLEEQQAVAPILAADPAFSGIVVEERSNGGIWLYGELPTPADSDRLRNQVIRAVGEPRSVEVMSPVHVKQ